VYAIKPLLPAVCGNEGVVQVLETGEEVRDLSPGDWLIPSHPGFGFWRTHIVRNRDDFIKVPKNIPLISAATMSINPCTAYRILLDYVDLRPNDVVVQNGANSGVGQSVIQLGQEMKIVTVNIVRNRPSIDNLKARL
uniref:Enoyl-[acyl-carrier-protein] reductase, mitochondrial n=1 Tax=Romanomermis culicivorax TaxID=13658 RepID=A0A915JAP6_ROMCU